MTHPNEELARTEMETALPADFEDMLAHYSENIVLHYPGRNARSGRYRGRHGLRVWSGKLDELLGPGGSLTELYMTSWRVTTTLFNLSRLSLRGPTGEGPVGRWR
jgi:hypothetical protein